MFFYVKSAASPEPKGIWIVSHPMSIQAELDQLVNLTCEVSGDPPITYQWTRDGVVLPGEVLSYFLIQEVKPKHRGVYVCVAMNRLNSVTSQPGLLSIIGICGNVSTHALLLGLVLQVFFSTRFGLF